MGPIQGHDVCGGQKQMMRSMQAGGLTAASFEIEDNPDEDLLTETGQKIFIRDSLRMEVGSLGSWGVPCKYAIWMTKSNKS